ncbi:LacI family DNA-binding transcriptional regulator [Micromonospora parastrephiae]|uniref:LacI family DNA-binding transcriptional regulator n=1 Tax=Micromonospora parastrephiae TaxID=2806101 RepID=UPI002814E9F7|nr:LacI family DNA-binding transcriptional regulator [Micromonospora parastrephiae]
MASTLKDVARLAGVSVKTVSNVINDYPHVSADVRRRVEVAVAQLGYRPNAFARTLRTGRTGVLALVLPDADLPYADDLTREVVHAAGRRGYRVVVERGPDEERNPSGLDDARPMPVDGVLVGAPGELAPALTAAGRPVVLIGGRASDSRCDRVGVDIAGAPRTPPPTCCAPAVDGSPRSVRTTRDPPVRRKRARSATTVRCAGPG